MSIETHRAAMSSEEIVALSREHTFFSWSVQGALDPIAIDRAEGVYLYTPEGRRILDFNSQLMSVNIGHGDRRVIDAITAQATQAAVRPAGVRHRAPGAARRQARRDPARRHGQGVLHARRRRGDRERDQARPPRTRGRHKILARYRSYHGATLGAMTLTGDPRRWANEPGIVGRRPLPGHASLGRGRAAPGRRVAPGPRGRHPLRGRRSTIAAVFLETIVGTNGILIPPDGYIAGRPRDLRPARHPDGRRRGHGRLRADRQAGSRSTTGT